MSRRVVCVCVCRSEVRSSVVWPVSRVVCVWLCVSAGQRSDRVSFDRRLESFACDCVCAGQRSDRVSFDQCLELFACDCVCLQVRGQIECRLTGVSSSRLRVIVCVQVRGQIECRLTGVSSSCLRVIVCVQVRGQIECRLTGVSSCLRVIVCVCVCLQVRGQIECRLTGVSSCLRVIVCVSAGQRSDRVSFNRCLVELFACDCVCAGQRSDRVSFDRCLELFACDCVCVCRSEVRLSVVWPVSLRVVCVWLTACVCVCRSEVRSSGQHGVRRREQRGGEESEGLWVICAETRCPAAAEGLYRAALLLTTRQTHGLPQRILPAAGKGSCLFA